LRLAFSRQQGCDRSHLGPQDCGDALRLPALTKRDAAAPNLGDVLTLARPRTDDPLHGIEILVSGEIHPTPEVPTPIDLIHAEKVSTLPLRNEKGSYDEHEMPPLATSAAVGEYIQNRTAAWRLHLQRRGERRARLRGGGGRPAPGGGGQHGTGGGHRRGGN
jgi:phospholipase C